MSGAMCFPCEMHIGTIENPIGIIGEPHGSCKNCSVFACGHHAERDSNIPGYICVICDQDLIAASGVLTAAVMTEPLEQIANRFYMYDPSSENLWRIKSLQDFISQRSGYNKSFFDPVIDGNMYIDFEQSWEDNNLRIALSGLSDDAKQLVTAAALLNIRLNIPTQLTPHYLVQIRNAIKDY